MSRIRTRYRLFSVCLILLLSLSAGVFFAVALDNVGSSYEEAGRNSLITAKRSFLRDTIENLIQGIDRTRNGFYRYYNDMLISAEGVLIDYYASDADSFVTKSGELFSSRAYRNVLRILIFNNDGKRLVYSSQNDKEYLSKADAIEDLLAKGQESTGFVLGEYQVLIWACDDPLLITFSAGVSFFSKEDSAMDEAIRRADKAMFHAKKNGRAMVCRHVDAGNDDEYSCEKPSGSKTK